MQVGFYRFHTFKTFQEIIDFTFLSQFNCNIPHAIQNRKNSSVTLNSETPSIEKTISIEKNLDLIFQCNSNLDEKTISHKLDTNLNETQYIKFKYFDSNIVGKKGHHTTATKRKYNEIILLSKYKLTKVLKTVNVTL